MTVAFARMLSGVDPQVPLADAMLCEDCDTISSRKQYCPACGSSSLLSLARVLNRTEAAQPA